MSPLRSAILLTLLLPACAFAASPISESRPLSPGARVQIDNLKGSIQVRGWDQEQARITGSLGEGVEKLVIEGQGQRLLIRVEYPQGGSWFGWGGDSRGEPSELEVMLPRSLATLEVESVSADQDIAGIEAASLDVSTVSGDLRIAASAREARIESVSGDQELEVATASLRAESVSGDIRLSGQVSGQVHAEAVSGDIEVKAGQLDGFSASTVSGDIDLDAALAAGARLRIEALSGDVTVTLPRATSARFSASSFSGGIDSDVGKVEKASHGPGTSLDARTGEGDAQVELETFSGEIELRLR